VRWLPASKHSGSNAKILSGKILEVGEQRIKEMEQDGIDMQVLSLISPGVQVLMLPRGLLWPGESTMSFIESSKDIRGSSLDWPRSLRRIRRELPTNSKEP